MLKYRNKDTHGHINILFLLTLVVNLVIPKAGIKIGGIPLTIGNLMIALLLIYSLIIGDIGNKKIKSASLLYICGICFWCVRFLVAFGTGSTLSDVIGYLIPLCVYPAAFFVAPLYLKNYKQIKRISRIIFWCLFCLFCYTMLQALFGIGSVDIPGITVNYSDYVTNPAGWWLEKSNAVGSASKMVSTYQNGNLFGVTIILLFPIGLSSEKNIFVKVIFWALFVLSVLLAGSRTVYLGLAILVVYYVVRGVMHMRVKIGTLVAMSAGAIAVVFAACFVVTRFVPDMFHRIMSLFDIDTMLQGAGRTNGAVEYFTWLAKQPVAFLFGGFGMDYNGFAYEMTYLCIFLLGGLVGFLLFLCFLLFTTGRILSRLPREDALARALLIGILTYWIIAFVEGGYWLPPVAWNVWMITGVARSYINSYKKQFTEYNVEIKERSAE